MSGHVWGVQWNVGGPTFSHTCFPPTLGPYQWVFTALSEFIYLTSTHLRHFWVCCLSIRTSCVAISSGFHNEPLNLTQFWPHLGPYCVVCGDGWSGTMRAGRLTKNTLYGPNMDVWAAFVWCDLMSSVWHRTPIFCAWDMPEKPSFLAISGTIYCTWKWQQDNENWWSVLKHFLRDVSTCGTM